MFPSPYSSGARLRLAALCLTAALSCFSVFAQQPTVPAPHNPVSPRLPDSLPPAAEMASRYLRGGLWMTDAYTKSSIYLRNDLEIASLPVTPVLYLSNGVKIVVPTITLEPNGTAVVSVNDALANQGISPNATLSGYVELQYQWPWDPICATISNIDATHSVIFTYGLGSMAPPSQKYKAGRTPVNPTPGPQVLEGAWWKQEPGVTGFVTLSNTTEQPLPATVQVADANAKPLGSYQITVSPHGTKRVDLQELTSLVNSFGGIHIAFSGAADAIIVNGSLEDLGKGYSATIPIGAPPLASAKDANLSYAELGLMAGEADPMMHFPAGTVFTPYSILRNIGIQPATVTPVVYWMQNGSAHSARQAAFVLAPLQTQNLDVLSLMAVAGLKNFNGTINLVFEIQAPQDSVILSSGSVDQSSTYVFEVVPGTAKISGSKDLAYWSIANGDDTMVTLWNPADEAQDFVFKFFFIGGQYLLPVHLEAKATRIFNVSEVINVQTPDAAGNVIPLGVHEGSAQVSGTQGENQLILVDVDSGVYNVRKATCAYICKTCNGATSWTLSAIPFGVAVSGSTQLTLKDTWNNGAQHNITSASTWGSSATNIATVSSGLVHGISVGNVSINGEDLTDPWYGQSCGSPPPACPVDMGGGASGPGSVLTFSLTVRFTGNKVPNNHLIFANDPDECKETLGATDCSLSTGWWLWNIEIEADVSDDVRNWLVTQSILGGSDSGYYKDANGVLHSYSGSIAPGDDSPGSSFLQQPAGQKQLFWIDGPGRKTTAVGYPIDSGTYKVNFVSMICSTINTGICLDNPWYVKLVFKSPGVLDLTNSIAAPGTAP